MLEPKQKAWLDNVVCQRLSVEENNDNYRLDFENEVDSIVEFITARDTFELDRNGEIAVYVIREGERIIAYFSLQCGVIFEKVVSKEDSRFFELYTELKNNRIDESGKEELRRYQAFHNLTQKQLEEAATRIEQKIRDVRPKKNDDAKNEPNEDVKIVHTTIPAIEIVHFGRIRNYDGDFNNLFPDQKMGEVLFMYKVVPTLRKVIDVIGVKFVYLFAVTNDRDNKLVAHYSGDFGFKSNPGYGVNKSLHASGCLFMAQSLSDLFKLAEDYTHKNKERLTE